MGCGSSSNKEESPATIKGKCVYMCVRYNYMYSVRLYSCILNFTSTAVAPDYKAHIYM